MSVTRAEAPCQKPVSCSGGAGCARCRTAGRTPAGRHSCGGGSRVHGAPCGSRGAARCSRASAACARWHAGTSTRNETRRIVIVAAAGGTPRIVRITLGSSVHVDHVERAEPVRADHVEPLRAVVHLVEQPPERREGMHRAVPGVGAELVAEHAGCDRGPGRPAGQVEQLQRRQGLGPQQRQVRGQQEIEPEGGEGAQRPAANLRQRPGGGEELPQQQAAEQGEQNLGGGVEQQVERRGHDGLLNVRAVWSPGAGTTKVFRATNRTFMPWPPHLTHRPSSRCSPCPR